MSHSKFALLLVIALCSSVLRAQEPPLLYGMPISTESAKKAATAALAEARKNNWLVVAAVVNPAGDLVYFEQLDGVQTASGDIAIAKASTAARFKRPTKSMQDTVAQGGAGLRFLALPATPVDGGLPLILDGKIVGAIGVSGVTSEQDAQCAKAGVDALTMKK